MSFSQEHQPFKELQKRTGALLCKQSACSSPPFSLKEPEEAAASPGGGGGGGGGADPAGLSLGLQLSSAANGNPEAADQKLLVESKSTATYCSTSSAGDRSLPCDQPSKSDSISGTCKWLDRTPPQSLASCFCQDAKYRLHCRDLSWKGRGGGGGGHQLAQLPPRTPRPSMGRTRWPPQYGAMAAHGTAAAFPGRLLLGDSSDSGHG